MAKLLEREWKGQKSIYFFCPGCKCGHRFDVPRWDFNGDFNNPTFNPSLLIYYNHPETNEHITTCHLFLRNGKIEFCGDCPHELKNQTVELPEWPFDYGKPGE